MMELVKPAPLRKSTAGICCLQNTIFVSGVAAGVVKIVLPLTGTVSFLQTLGKLYYSFGIGAQTADAVSLSQGAVNNVSSVKTQLLRLNSATT